MADTKSDTGKIHLLSDAVWDLQSKNPKLADSLAGIELQYGQRCSYPKYQADAYNDAGTVKYRLGDFSTSKVYHMMALDIRRKAGDEAGVGSSLGKLGALYQKTGDLDKALGCQLECLAIQEKLHNPVNIALTYNNIAVIQSNQKNYRKSIDYAQKALAINIPGMHRAASMANYNTLANAYSGLGNYDSALLLLDSVAAIAGQLGDKNAIATAYCNIGNTYEHKADSVQALAYYINALALATEIKNRASIGMYSLNIGDIYRRSNQYEKAEPYLLTAYQTARELDQKPVLYSSGLSLYYIYKHKGNLTKAAEYVEESIAEKDSVYNEESSKQIAEMQTKYETEKKEQQLQIQTLQINRRNIILVILSMAFLLSAVIGWLAYNRYKLRQKALMATEMLRQQQLRSKAIIDAEEQERQRIGKDLHDGVGQILSAAKLNLSALQTNMPDAEQSNKDKMQNALDLLDDSVKEVRSISHNMMPNMLIRAGLASAVRDFVNKMSGNDKLKIDLDITGMNTRLDATLESVLYRIFQEIIHNILRHSGATHVTVQLLQHEHEVVLMIEDNGRGFDVAGTLSRDTGLGLKNISSRVEYLHGRVDFDSAAGKGTTVTVEIPIAYETNNS